MNRGDLYWVRLDPTEGSEIGKTRPCVVVSLDALNKTLPTVVVCPLTSVVRPSWRSRLQVVCDGKLADVCADQIRTVTKTRLAKKIGILSAKEAAALRALLGEMYGDG